MQHRVKVDLIHPGHRADITRHRLLDFILFITLKPVEVSHFEGFAGIADE